MSRRCLHAVALAAALLPPCTWAAPLTLESALERAVGRSEAARAARAGEASAAEAARAAGRLPDPMLRAGVDNLPVTGPDRLSTTREAMTMKRIGIAQEWLSADKRALRRAAAEAAVEREAVQARAAVAATRLQAALAYLDAWYAGQALRLATLTEHHAHEELEAARARLASAAGGGAEALALAGAQGLAEDDAAEARQQQGAAAVALQRWVGAPAEELAEPALPAVPAEDAYVAAHPAVAALQRDVELARQAAAVARGERTPNWTWELSYGQRTGQADLLSFGVSIPLPVAPDQRQDRETAAKLALVDQAQAALAEAMRAAAAEYRTLAGDVQRLEARIERYRAGVVAPAAQRTAAVNAAYRSNQAGLAALFEARHAEVEAERRLLRLQRELAQARARLVFTPLAAGGAA